MVIHYRRIRKTSSTILSSLSCLANSSFPYSLLKSMAIISLQMKMKSTYIILILFSLIHLKESIDLSALKTSTKPKTSSDGNRLDNRLVPAVSQHRVFDTKSFDTQELRLILNSERSEDNQDLSEESSGFISD